MSQLISPLNEIIENSLDKYLSIKDPNYAIYINGDWGAGKTWFIKTYTEKKGKDRFLYISLYGTKSIEDIEDQIFQILHPKLASKKVNYASKVIKQVVKTAADIDLSETKLSEFIDMSHDKILIFDDLERSNIELEELLGYINYNVEHSNSPVIILGDQKKLKQPEKFEKTHEKSIGKRFQYKPEFEKAIEHFLIEIDDDKLKSAITTRTKQIKQIFDKGNCGNLRILKNAMKDFSYLLDIIDAKYLSSAEFLDSFVNTFFVLFMEVKLGHIKETEIAKIESAYLEQEFENSNAKDKKQPENPITHIQRIFKSNFKNQWDQITPNSFILSEFFQYGYCNKTELNQAIENSRFFVSTNSPTWVRTWNYGNYINDEDFDKDVELLKNEYMNLKYNVQGEIKHCVANLLFFQKKGLINDSRKSIEKLIDLPLNQLIKQKKILVMSKQEQRDFRRDYAFGGLGFLNETDPKLIEVNKRLDAYQQKKRIESAMSNTSKLLHQIRTNAVEFAKSISFSGLDDECYMDVPILSGIDHNAFVDTFFETTAKNKIYVNSAIKERFQQLKPEIAIAELPWLKRVVKTLSEKAKNQRNLTRSLTQELIDDSLKNSIKNIEAHIKQIKLKQAKK